jgi:SAM-dependent methyltransferase
MNTIIRFLSHINLVREDIQQDLEGIKLNLPEYRIGDFGCGDGLTTLCLALDIPNSHCIGIDKFETSETFSVPTLSFVRQQLNDIRNFAQNINSADEKIEALLKDIYQTDQKNLFPKVILGDVVLNTNLPTDLDLVYCGKLLKNIKNSAYANPTDGDESLLLVVQNVVKTLKAGGQLLVIDFPCEIDYVSLLQSAGLNILSHSRIERGDIGENERITLYKNSLIKIVSIKPI